LSSKEKLRRADQDHPRRLTRRSHPARARAPRDPAPRNPTSQPRLNHPPRARARALRRTPRVKEDPNPEALPPRSQLLQRAPRVPRRAVLRDQLARVPSEEPRPCKKLPLLERVLPEEEERPDPKTRREKERASESHSHF